MAVGALAACVVTSLVAPGVTRADHAAKDVRRTSGLAVGTGLYSGTGGLGGQLAYYGEWGHPWIRLGGFMGMGWSLADGDQRPGEKLGVSLGGFGSVGRRSHRLYFDLDASLLGYVEVEDDAFQRRYWTVSTSLGYEVVTRRGFLFRLAGGPGVKVLRGTLWEPLDRLDIAFQLLLGWKLW